jgi:alpha-D-xyloside xylohydrolase
LLRTLFFEFPADPTAWFIDDQYMFGPDLLVAPLFSPADTRRVYLPPGKWFDYQSGQQYEGNQWHNIKAGAIPIVLLVKDGSAIPQVAVAQSTADIDWKHVELRVFSSSHSPATALFALPGKDLQMLRLTPESSGYRLESNPLAGKVEWQIHSAATATQ